MDKTLFTIATLAICSIGTYAFAKIYIGHIHMHPPTEHDIKKIRKEVGLKDNEKSKMIRQPKKEKKFEHPKKFRPHIN